MSILFFCLAGIFNAVMDKLAYHYERSIFSGLKAEWFNPFVSWKNHNGFIMSTILVMVTDAWHLSKFLMIICLSCGAYFYKNMLGVFDIVLLYLAFTVTFELFFSVILEK